MDTQHILIAGAGKQAISLTVCLLQAGAAVTLLNEATADVLTPIDRHLAELHAFTGQTVDRDGLTVTHTLEKMHFRFAIAVTGEDAAEKAALIKKMEAALPAETLIAINTESIALSTLQKDTLHPGRIIGANWTEPVHTTCFLEIITNKTTHQQLAADFYNTARDHWQKDPYILKNDRGIRTRMLCALLREAFYLVENKYVEIEDIDRACRNDAGYYLPFAGNFRYMDLMGGYMYGIVMQDLNPELSTGTHIPRFCQELIDAGCTGMAGGKGFYNYTPAEAAQWEETFHEFSYRIRQIIDRYPSAHIEADTLVNT